MTKEEYEQIYAEGFRAGWQEAVKTLQNLEPPPIRADAFGTITTTVPNKN